MFKKVAILLTLIFGIVSTAHGANNAGSAQLRLYMEHYRNAPPQIGHYYGAAYHFTTPILTLDITQAQAQQAIPGAVNAINGQADRQYFISIRGTVPIDRQVRPQDPTVLPPWNVTFHAWSRVPIGAAQPMQMGIFNANGVQAVGGNGMPIGQLAARQINPHDDHLSPNNAQFNAAANRQFLTFGLAGTRPPRGIAVYQIFINNPDAQAILQGNLGGYAGPQEVINLLDSDLFKANFQNQADRQAIDQAVAHLGAMFNIRAGQAHFVAPGANIGNGFDAQQLEQAIQASLAQVNNQQQQPQTVNAILEHFIAAPTDTNRQALQQALQARYEEFEPATANLALGAIAPPENQQNPNIGDFDEDEIARAIAASLQQQQQQPPPPPQPEPEDEEDLECAICMETMHNTNDNPNFCLHTETSPVPHILHSSCIRGLIQYRQRQNLSRDPENRLALECPVCRTNLTPEELRHIRDNTVPQCPGQQPQAQNPAAQEQQQNQADDDQEESDNECPICYTEEANTQLPCNHRFCNTCLHNVEEINNNMDCDDNHPNSPHRHCPTCRAPFTQQNIPQEGSPQAQEYENRIRRLTHPQRSLFTLQRAFSVVLQNPNTLSDAERTRLARLLNEKNIQLIREHYQEALNPARGTYGDINRFPGLGRNMWDAPTQPILHINQVAPPPSFAYEDLFAGDNPYLLPEDREYIRNQLLQGHALMAEDYYFSRGEGRVPQQESGGNMFARLPVQDRENARQLLLRTILDDRNPGALQSTYQNRQRPGRDVLTPLGSASSTQAQREAIQRLIEQVQEERLDESLDDYLRARAGHDYVVLSARERQLLQALLQNQLAQNQIQNSRQRNRILPQGGRMARLRALIQSGTNAATVRNHQDYLDLTETNRTTINDELALRDAAPPPPRPPRRPGPPTAPRPASTQQIMQAYQNAIANMRTLPDGDFAHWISATGIQGFGRLTQQIQQQLEDQWNTRVEQIYHAEEALVASILAAVTLEQDPRAHADYGNLSSANQDRVRAEHARRVREQNLFPPAPPFPTLTEQQQQDLYDLIAQLENGDITAGDALTGLQDLAHPQHVFDIFMNHPSHALHQEEAEDFVAQLENGDIDDQQAIAGINGHRDVLAHYHRIKQERGL